MRDKVPLSVSQIIMLRPSCRHKVPVSISDMLTSSLSPTAGRVMTCRSASKFNFCTTIPADCSRCIRNPEQKSKLRHQERTLLLVRGSCCNGSACADSRFESNGGDKTLNSRIISTCTHSIPSYYCYRNRMASNGRHEKHNFLCMKFASIQYQ